MNTLTIRLVKLSDQHIITMIITASDKKQTRIKTIPIIAFLRDELHYCTIWNLFYNEKFDMYADMSFYFIILF